MSHEPIVLAFAATFVVLKILRTKPLSTDFTQEPATNRHLERMNQILCGKLPRMEFTSSTTPSFAADNSA
jgi:hypothetical protein